MTAPRVFISSTFYDLSVIRENLEVLVKSIGYEPILSEKGNIFYDYNKDVLDACLKEVSSCQLFILIIGGRSGAGYKDSKKSITNMEYLAAKDAKIPIFSVVKNGVMHQYRTWLKNKDVKIVYPDVQTSKVFDFIEEVKCASFNNAIQTFDSFEDIRHYLLQQWSGMMYYFLTSESQYKKANEMLSEIKSISEKIEFISRKLAKDAEDKLLSVNLEMMDFIDASLRFPLEYLREESKIDFSPITILKNPSLQKFFKHNNINYKVSEKSSSWGDIKKRIRTSGGPEWMIGLDAFDAARKNYIELREMLMKLLKDAGIDQEDFFSDS